VAQTTNKPYCGLVGASQPIKEYNLLNRFGSFKDKNGVLSQDLLKVNLNKSQEKNFELLKKISNTNNMSGNNARNISNTNRLATKSGGAAKCMVTRR